jgi:hypothetical protein
MTRPSFTNVLAALALVAALPAGAEPRCDVGLLRGPGVPPEQLLSCVRIVAGASTSAEGELLRAALGALVDASFTLPAADEPDLARRLIAELQRRGALGPDDHRTLRKVLLQNGRLDDVAADRAANPAAHEVAIPERRFMATPPLAGEVRYWRWEVRGTVLVERSIDLAHGTHLVIDASPGCQFCARAVADIDRDPALARLFDGALWITRPEQGLDPAYWARWNDAHPAHPMVLVLDATGWDLPPQWSTPQFRFFRDGRVVASLRGWTTTSRETLLAVGRNVGLLKD